METRVIHAHWTKEKQERFLCALADNPNVSAVCQSEAISRATAYYERDRDEEFRAAWDAAVQLGTRALEDEAIRRAREGTEEPVFYQGAVCGSVRKYSDVLLIFLLKARDPKYRERSALELSGPGGGPVQSVGIQTSDPIEAARLYQQLIHGETG
jgi:hypothetical protein